MSARLDQLKDRLRSLRGTAVADATPGSVDDLGDQAFFSDDEPTVGFLEPSPEPEDDIPNDDFSSLFVESGREGIGKPRLEAGQVVRGRYTIVERVATGGMSTVYKAIDRELEAAGKRDCAVALKFARTDLGAQHSDPEFLLQREAIQAERLEHPNIVKVLDLDAHGGHHFIVMEWLEGSTLGQLLRRGGRIAFARARQIVEDIATALAYAHRKGIVHGDVTLNNIHITPEGRAKLIDFGVAINRDYTKSPALELIAFTRSYASCEVLEGETPEPQDDIYSLGCIAYRLFAKRKPYDGHQALRAEQEGKLLVPIDELPAPVWQAIYHALAFRRENRTPDAKTFLAEIGRSSDAEESTRFRWLPKLPGLPRLPRLTLSWRHWRRRLALSGGLFAGMLVAFGIAYYLGASSTSETTPSGPRISLPEAAAPMANSETRRGILDQADAIPAEIEDDSAIESAVASYKRLLAEDPFDPAATAGMDRIIAARLNSFAQAISRGDLNAAGVDLAAAETMQKDHPGVRFARQEFDRLGTELLNDTLEFGRSGDYARAYASLTAARAVLGVEHPELGETEQILAQARQQQRRPDLSVEDAIIGAMDLYDSAYDWVSQLEPETWTIFQSIADMLKAPAVRASSEDSVPSRADPTAVAKRAAPQTARLRSLNGRASHFRERVQ